MGNIPALSLYQDSMSTAATNKWGMLELESRTNSNAIADILNGAWTAWTPTVVYTLTGPSNLGSTATTTEVALYKQIGQTVFFNYQCISGIQSAINVSTVTISLPVTPRDNDTYPVVNAMQLATAGAYINPMGYIDMTTGTAAGRVIKFRALTALAATQTYNMQLNGIYEIA